MEKSGLSFEDLLQSDQSVRIHHRNIHSLGIELYKTRNNISSQIMNELFGQRNIIFNDEQISLQDQLALLIMV